MDTSAGNEVTTKRLLTQATQRKKITNQLNNFLTLENPFNYKKFAKLLVSENKEDKTILRKMNIVKK
jgi:hypothetical protein